MATDGGRLVLVFDDGFTADFEEVLPVLRSAGVPACFAVNPHTIGDAGSLTADRLETLAAEGCEIAAHGRRHRFLRGRRLDRDVLPGDERIRVTDHVFPHEEHGLLSGDRLELTDGTARETVTVASAGAADDGAYVDVTAPIDGRYAREVGLVRPDEELVHDEVVGAAEDLLGLGFDPRTFVFPYDAADARAWSTARRHYEVLPNASIRSLPNPPGTPLSNLRRCYLETDAMTPPGIAAYLDAVAELGGLGILAGHGARETVPPERVALVVEAALDRGIDVTTFEEIAEGAPTV